MEQSAKEDECGICLEALTNPVVLPCNHKFCSKCLHGWRSKYGALAYKSSKDKEKERDKKCPLCRQQIPPSKEMVTQLKFWRNQKSYMEAKGDTSSALYKSITSASERLEQELGDVTETIDYSESKRYLVLPIEVHEAASRNNIEEILHWLGPPPVDEQRVNARDAEFMDITLVFHAVMQEFGPSKHFIATWRGCRPFSC